MSSFDICLLVALAVAVVYGWLVQRQIFAPSRWNNYSQVVAEWLHKYPLYGLVALIFSTQLAVLSLVVTAVFEYGPLPFGNALLGFALTAICSAITLCMFAAKGFMWSWLVSQIEATISKLRR